MLPEAANRLDAKVLPELGDKQPCLLQEVSTGRSPGGRDQQAVGGRAARTHGKGTTPGRAMGLRHKPNPRSGARSQPTALPVHVVPPPPCHLLRPPGPPVRKVTVTFSTWFLWVSLLHATLLICLPTPGLSCPGNTSRMKPNSPCSPLRPHPQLPSLDRWHLVVAPSSPSLVFGSLDLRP